MLVKGLRVDCELGAAKHGIGEAHYSGKSLGTWFSCLGAWVPG